VKILHTARYTGIPWEILKSVVPNDFSVETLDELSYDCLLRQAIDADYLLVSGRLPIDEGVLSAAKHLKMIQRTGVGTEMLDVEAIKSHGIPMYVNAGVNAQSVAEHTLTLMLAALKRLPQINAQTHNGVWKKQQVGVTTHELKGKTVGLVGMGNIGRLVAAMLQPFGVKVLYTDVFRQNEKVENDLALTYCESFETMLPQCDILSFHCPLTKENTDMLNKETLSMMKQGAIVVNTARGKLINPDDLYEALKSGQLSAAALDTHYEEPLKENNKLAELENVILTPHIGGLSYEAFHQMMADAIKNIVAFEEGRIEEIKERRIK
jgi:D-3-phosphoglycerate dehydrogenase